MKSPVDRFLNICLNQENVGKFSSKNEYLSHLDFLSLFKGKFSLN